MESMQELWWRVLESEAYLWAVCISFFVLIERVFPRVRAQPPWRKEWGQDVGWLVLNVFLNHSWARVVAVLSIFELSNLDAIWRSHVPALDSMAGWPLLAQFAIVFVVADFLAWYLHRLSHRNGFLWRFHVLHHSSERMDWLATFRGHWIDGVFLDLSYVLPLALLPVDFRVLILFGAFDLLAVTYLHANLPIGRRPGWLFRWVGSPVAHHWHHSAENRLKYGQNFGRYTLIWDRLFGTFHLPADHAAPERFGLQEQGKYYRGFFRRFFMPFVSRGNL